jgi:hypothetical protein
MLSVVLLSYDEYFDFRDNETQTIVSRNVMECSGYCARTSGCSAMFYNEESLDCELGSKRPGANVIKLFLTVIYNFRSKLERLLDLAGKACHEEKLSSLI